ncbi:MAG: FAD-binding protein, partial [Bacteroidaceae bacterium]|nr:FAD-binding protein [Bacteroidaceae bacterium]
QGGRRQCAPAERMTDFVNHRLSADLPAVSYTPGVVASPLHFWMPAFITRRLEGAFKEWGRMRRGFLTAEATVIAAETRTSAPVRISRQSDTLQSPALQGLFPCGEGAGYAGGIVSAAIDGERCAEAVAAYLGH